MKSRTNVLPFSVPFQSAQRARRVDGSRSRQQRRLLLGVSLLLILCWMIGAIGLISLRRGERNMAEVSVQQRAIAMAFSTKIFQEH